MGSIHELLSRFPAGEPVVVYRDDGIETTAGDDLQRLMEGLDDVEIVQAFLSVPYSGSYDPECYCLPWAVAAPLAHAGWGLNRIARALVRAKWDLNWDPYRAIRTVGIWHDEVICEAIADALHDTEEHPGTWRRMAYAMKEFGEDAGLVRDLAELGWSRWEIVSRLSKFGYSTRRIVRAFIALDGLYGEDRYSVLSKEYVKPFGPGFDVHRALHGMRFPDYSLHDLVRAVEQNQEDDDPARVVHVLSVLQGPPQFPVHPSVD